MKLGAAAVVLAVGFAALHRAVRGTWPTRRPRIGSDLVYFVVVDPIAKVGVQLALVPLALACLALGVAPPEVGLGFGPIGDLPDPVQLVAMLLLADLVGYWAHRAFHHFPLLWRFHAVHHSPERLDWLAAARVHPVNEIVQRAVVAAPLLALGFDPRVFAAVAPILTLHALVLHADLPWTYGWLGRWIASPRFHRDHHRRDAGAVNLGGLTPVWDRAFGTARFSDEEPVRFGVEEAIPDGALGSVWWPFRRPRVTGPGSACGPATGRGRAR